jgi:LEA14-like dessication related protein
MCHQVRSFIHWFYSLTLVLGLSLTLAGCQSMQGLLNASDKPTARLTNVQIQGLSLDAASLLFNVEISNPYGVPLPLSNLDYSLASGGGGPFLAGKAELQETIPAKGSRVVGLPLQVGFAQVFEKVSGIKPGGVVPYTANLTLSVDAPVVGTMSLLMTKAGSLPVPAPPEVAVEGIQFNTLTMSEAAAVMHLRVVNPNSFAVGLQKMSYSLALADQQVLRSGGDFKAKFAANGGANTLDIPISFSPSSLGLAGFRMLTGQGAGYNIGGSMNFDTPFGPIDLPYQRAGKTVFKR